MAWKPLLLLVAGRKKKEQLLEMMWGPSVLQAALVKGPALAGVYPWGYVTVALDVIKRDTDELRQAA